MRDINDHDFKDMPDAYWQYKLYQEKNRAIQRELELVRDAIPLKKIERALEKKRLMRCRCDLELEQERTKQFEIQLEIAKQNNFTKK